MSDIKTFNDIEFTYDERMERYLSKTELGRGLVLSVVYGGPGNYCEMAVIDGEQVPVSFEAALFFGNDFVPLTPHDDVIGWQTAEEITALMNTIQTDKNFVRQKVDEKEEYRKEVQ